MSSNLKAQSSDRLRIVPEPSRRMILFLKLLTLFSQLLSSWLSSDLVRGVARCCARAMLRCIRFIASMTSGSLEGLWYWRVSVSYAGYLFFGGWWRSY